MSFTPVSSFKMLRKGNQILGDCMWVCGYLAQLRRSFNSSQSRLSYTVAILTSTVCDVKKYSHKDDFASAFCLNATARLAAQCSCWIQPIKWLLVTVTVLYCRVTVSLLMFQSFCGNSVAFPDGGQWNVKSVCARLCALVCANHTVWHKRTVQRTVKCHFHFTVYYLHYNVNCILITQTFISLAREGLHFNLQFQDILLKIVIETIPLPSFYWTKMSNFNLKS